MGDTFRALVVEDNEADAYWVTKLIRAGSSLLTALGTFEAESASRMETALERLKQDPFDVVLLDLGLPDSQGLDTLRALRAAHQAASVVVLTGSTEAELGVRALSLGAQDFLPKDELSAPMILRTLRYAIERHRAERQVKATIQEKEVLLRELNHRAKNNLQVIAALLSLEARRAADPSFKQLVARARERIEALSLAHEQLQSSGSSLMRIDFSGYLKTLAKAIHSSHGGSARGITLDIDAGEHYLPLDRAVTAGLIVNALLTNAFKHAFSPNEIGTVSLRVRGLEDSLLLEVADTGVGMPDGLTASPSRGLGLELVATLSEQLDASVESRAGSGTRIAITIPLGDKS